LEGAWAAIWVNAKVLVFFLDINRLKGEICLCRLGYSGMMAAVGGEAVLLSPSRPPVPRVHRIEFDL
jgi:hypothetical protein